MLLRCNPAAVTAEIRDLPQPGARRPLACLVASQAACFAANELGQPRKPFRPAKTFLGTGGPFSLSIDD